MRKLITVVTCDICQNVVYVVFSYQSQVTKELKANGWQVDWRKNGEGEQDICWRCVEDDAAREGKSNP